MSERSSRPNRHLGDAPQQTSDEQVLDIIAAAGLATSSIPVVQEREQALRTGGTSSLELRRTGESGFREAMRVASLVMLGLFFVGIGLGVVIHSLGFPWWLAPLLPGVLFAGVCRVRIADDDDSGCLAGICCGDDATHQFTPPHVWVILPYRACARLSR